jgi:hypothetical protein
VVSYRRLDAAAMSQLAAKETIAVEVLRDSNSRQFEGHARGRRRRADAAQRAR